MKAIIIAGPGDARMIEIEKPKVGKTDVLAKVVYSGICGTDLSILSGDMKLIREGFIKYPVRIGHEWSGIVAEVGKEVKRFKPGERVVSDNGVSCGECKHCREGDYGLCENIKSVGTVNCWDGSFAEYMLMPERHLYKLPDNISLEEAAMIEPTTIALAGLKSSNIKAYSKVLIIGTGPIGLAAIPFAKSMGAEKIFVSGRKPYKLNVAKTMGADRTINVTTEDLTGIVMKETGGKGVDIVIDTSGNPDAFNQCIDVVAQGGVIILIGFYENNLKDFDIDKLVTKSIRLQGILGEFGLPQQVIDIMEKEKISLKPLITHRFRFDEAIEAMKTANEKNDTKIKMLVEIG
jgi:2-desacetyl-2-hydroxyethyl bacteriochlorophyllide A dehydrogenase